MRKHPGRPKGSDTVPAWLTPGEFVMNAEAARMFAPQIQAMNDRGKAVQKAQGGTIPEMGTIPIPTTPNPSAAYQEGGAVKKSIVPKAKQQSLNWIDQIKMREGGLKREIYIDSEGFPTVGIGHRLPDEYKSKEGQTLFSDDQLNKWFNEDIAKATSNASNNISNFNSLDNNVQGALINQAFQLGGTGQKGFKNMIKAIEAGDMNKAATEALDSKWLKQTPKRANDLASILRGEEPKMEYNKGGPVPRYYGLGDWVRSLFSDDEDDRFTMPDATSLSGTPNYMFSNKNDIRVPPKVQTNINTDGSYFNPPYAGEPVRMGDSNFEVPEPPKFSDQDLIQNSSNSLKDVPLINLKDQDLGALAEQGDARAEEVLKQRRMESQFGTLVNTEEGMDPDMFMKNFPEQGDPRPESQFGVPVNMESGMDTDMFNRNFTDPRIGAVENYSVPANPDLYDPRRGAVENYSVPKNTYVPTNFNPERRRLEDEAYNRFGMNLNNDNTLSPIEKPVDLDPRIGVPEYYGVPKVNESKRGRIGERVKPEVESTFLANATPEQIDQYNAEKERLALEKETIGKTGFNVNEAGRQEIYNQKVEEAKQLINNSEAEFAKAKNEKERLEVVQKIKDANALIANSKTKARIEDNKQKLLERGQATQINQELDSKISALQKELGTATDPNHKAFLKKEIDRLQGNKVDTTTDVLSEDKKQEDDSDGGGVNSNNSSEDNLDNAKNSKNKQLENDPTIKDKGENAPPEVKAAAVEQVKSVFGEMFDVEELTRMAILYLGARATGASGSQAMAFAGKSYLSRLDNKFKQNKFNEHFNSLLKGNNFTRDSMELYKYTKDPNVLVTKSSIQSNIRRVGGGSIFYPKVKTAGVAVPEIRLYESKIGPKGNEQTVYTFADGSIANLENFHQERGLVAGTDEYQESINKYKTSLEKVVTPKFNAFKPDDANRLPGNPKVWKMINGKQGDFLQDAAAFSKEVRYNTGQILETSIIDNAFENLAQDVADDKIEGSIRFKNYLDDAYIKANVGHEGR